jgi:hypothetical protein
MSDKILLNDIFLNEVRSVMLELVGKGSRNPPTLKETRLALGKAQNTVFQYWHQVCEEIRAARDLNKNGQMDNFTLIEKLKSATDDATDLSTLVETIEYKLDQISSENNILKKSNNDYKIENNNLNKSILILNGRIEQLETELNYINKIKN